MIAPGSASSRRGQPPEAVVAPSATIEDPHVALQRPVEPAQPARRRVARYARIHDLTSRRPRPGAARSSAGYASSRAARGPPSGCRPARRLVPAARPRTPARADAPAPPGAGEAVRGAARHAAGGQQAAAPERRNRRSFTGNVPLYCRRRSERGAYPAARSDCLSALGLSARAAGPWPCRTAGARRRLARRTLRVHVNGTRGRSTVTRLIWSALRRPACRPWRRPRERRLGSCCPMAARTGRQARPREFREQLAFLRFARRKGVRAVVAECMALDPYLQSVSDRECSRLGRGDHQREDRPHGGHGARPRGDRATLANTIPLAGSW